ncbi:MAG: MarR family transcriptional regulator [Bacillus subtilis]|nr:MarR family transcriptional regulator [Bacillus subtilis]
MSEAKKLINELLVEIFNRILAIEEEALRNAGVSLSMTEIHVLEAVGNVPEPSMTMIAAKLGITVGSLTTSVATLANKGFVVRKRPDDDRRKVLVELDAGRPEDAGDPHEVPREDDRVDLPRPQGRRGRGAARLAPPGRHVFPQIDIRATRCAALFNRNGGKSASPLPSCRVIRGNHSGISEKHPLHHRLETPYDHQKSVQRPRRLHDRLRHRDRHRLPVFRARARRAAGIRLRSALLFALRPRRHPRRRRQRRARAARRGAADQDHLDEHAPRRVDDRAAHRGRRRRDLRSGEMLGPGRERR